MNLRFGFFAAIVAVFLTVAEFAVAGACHGLISSGRYICCGEDPGCGKYVYCCGAPAGNDTDAAASWTANTRNKMSKSVFIDYFGPSGTGHFTTVPADIDTIYAMYAKPSNLSYNNLVSSSRSSSGSTGGSTGGTTGGIPAGTGNFSFCNPLTSNAATCGTGGMDAWQIIDKVMGFVLGLALIVCPIFIIWGGFEMATANGEEAKISNGRKIITWAIIGLIICAVSGGIVKIIQEVFT